MGTFTISIDTELAWGYCDRLITPADRREIELERDVIARLLELFERYRISATWAVVGHLLLEGCERDGEHWHPEIPRPVDSSGRDWFWQHPEERDDRLWYARDVARKIGEADPPQEIASHSFAHVLFDESDTRAEAVAADLREARKVHEANEIEFKSFVFPRNVVGFRRLLAESGVRVYRGSDGHAPSPVAIARARRLAAFLLPTSARLVRPRIDELGLVDVPGSMLLIGRNGLRNIVPPSFVKRKAIKALDASAAADEVFHLWFHPSNLVHGSQTQFEILDAILRHADGLRSGGTLQILTMGQVADRTLERK
ncbi:MAG TPA: polysaccharide deacetylase [Actinomycetota bacterium]|nr:polysaccharide deacetylase [Actinomycetota bacterium]